MNDPFVKFKGGFRVGWFSGSYPFATLVVSSDKLRLIIQAFFFTSSSETYEFSPDQIVSIEQFRVIPLFFQGLRLRHVVTSYPQNLIFFSLSNPQKIYSEIVRVGFRPSASPALILPNRGIPFRWSFIVLFLIFWNFPYFLSYVMKMNNKVAGAIVTLELLVVCLVAALAPRSPFIQNVLLRPGRNIKEVSLFLKFLSYLTGFLFCLGAILVLFTS